MGVKKKLLAAGAMSALALTGTARAQPTQTLQQLQQQLEQQQRTLQAQQQQIEEQKKTLEQTRQQLEHLEIQKQTPTAETPPRREQPSPSEPTQVGKAPTQPQNQRAAEVAPVMQQPGVLTPRGDFVLEPSVQYSYSTNDRVALIGFTIIPAITIGLIDVREVNRTAVIGALTGRVGITNRLEFETRVPYVYRHDESVTRPLAQAASQNQVFDAAGEGIGDVEVALRYQFNAGGPDTPYFIGSLRGILPTGKDPFEVRYASASSSQAGSVLQERLPTGSGFYGVEPGLTVIFPSDPAVFFGGVNYLWSLSRNVDKTVAGTFIGHVNPGDAIGLNFGLGFAINERSSFSMGYQHTFIEKTKFDGNTPSDETSTQLGQWLFGYAYRMSDNTNLNLTVGAGLTRDTPDVEVTLRLPIVF